MEQQLKGVFFECLWGALANLLLLPAILSSVSHWHVIQFRKVYENNKVVRTYAKNICIFLAKYLFMSVRTYAAIFWQSRMQPYRAMLIICTIAIVVAPHRKPKTKNCCWPRIKYTKNMSRFVLLHAQAKKQSSTK